MNSRIIRKRKKKKRKIKLFVLTILLVLIGGVGIYAFDIVNSTRTASKKIYEPLKADALVKEIKVSEEPFTILLAGIENQDGGRGRSDVLMLASVNPKTKQISMTSIPRDLRVYLPMQDFKTKINHSYSYDGIEGTIKTISSLLDVPINYYITTNFDGFEQIVDTLGGVEVDVPFTFKAQLTGSLKYKTYTQGQADLNGNEALAFVRMRKSDPAGDRGRNERQQQVIKAIVNKATNFSSVTKVDDIITDLGDNVKTNIRTTKFLEFAKLYGSLKNEEIINTPLTGQDTTIDNVFYILPDDDSLQDVSEVIKAVLAGEPISTPSEASETTNTALTN